MRIKGMLPEALQVGGWCVPRQLAVLLKLNCDAELAALCEGPWNGQVSTEMLQKFCEGRYNLMVFVGNVKLCTRRPRVRSG